MGHNYWALEVICASLAPYMSTVEKTKRAMPSMRALGLFSLILRCRPPFPPVYILATVVSLISPPLSTSPARASVAFDRSGMSRTGRACSVSSGRGRGIGHHISTKGGTSIEEIRDAHPAFGRQQCAVCSEIRSSHSVRGTEKYMKSHHC